MKKSIFAVFVLYCIYPILTGKTVAMCFGFIRNLYQNKSVFVAKIGYSD